MTCCGNANRDVVAPAVIDSCISSNRFNLEVVERDTMATANRALIATAIAPKSLKTVRQHATSQVFRRHAIADRNSTIRASSAFFLRVNREFNVTLDRCAPVIDTTGICPALKVYRDCYHSDLKASIDWLIDPACI